MLEQNSACEMTGYIVDRIPVYNWAEQIYHLNFFKILSIQFT